MEEISCVKIRGDKSVDITFDRAFDDFVRRRSARNVSVKDENFASLFQLDSLYPFVFKKDPNLCISISFWIDD